MKKQISTGAIALAVVAALAACHGGSTMLPAAPGADGAFSLAAPAAGRADAWGIVVQDRDGGRPLADVRVRLLPWKPCDVVKKKPEKLRCPKAVYETKTAHDGRFTLHARAGHYLLVIGDDVPYPQSKWATVHDNVSLEAGSYQLKAPLPCVSSNQSHCLPPIPFYTPAPPERNGTYRLTKITYVEQQSHCILEFNKQRTNRGLVPTVVDEWLTENVRAAQVYAYKSTGTSTPSPIDPFGAITSGNLETIGGKSCVDLVADIFSGSSRFYSENRQTLWYAGRYRGYVSGSKEPARGAAEFPIDPRTGYHDPNVGDWP